VEDVKTWTHIRWDSSCAVYQSEQDLGKGSADNLLNGENILTRHTRSGSFLLQKQWTCGFYKNRELFVHMNGILSKVSLYNKTAQPLGLGLCLPCVTHHHPHVLACQHKRAILEHQAHETGIPARQLYLPQCQEKDGSFDPIQCHPVTRQCWCVDSGGDELPGTRAPPNVQPSCAGTQSVTSALEMSSSNVD